LYPEPGMDRDPSTPWPYWPLKLMNSHAHEEGGEREWSVSVTGFSGDGGRVAHLHAVRVEVERVAGRRSKVTPISGTEFDFPVDLVLLAIGFTGPTPEGLVASGDFELDERGNFAVDRN